VVADSIPAASTKHVSKTLVFIFLSLVSYFVILFNSQVLEHQGESIRRNQRLVVTRIEEELQKPTGAQSKMEWLSLMDIMDAATIQTKSHRAFAQWPCK
jgi:hypothetical protein